MRLHSCGLLTKWGNGLSECHWPTEAVLEDNQVLLITADGVLEAGHFEPGLTNWNFIEVLSGLVEGDAIVLSVGRDGVEPGAYVRVQE